MLICPKCQGQMFPEFDQDCNQSFPHCIFCGHTQYPEPQLRLEPEDDLKPPSPLMTRSELKAAVQSGSMPPYIAARLAVEYHICNRVTVYKWAWQAGIIFDRRGRMPKGGPGQREV